MKYAVDLTVFKNCKKFFCMCYNQRINYKVAVLKYKNKIGYFSLSQKCKVARLQLCSKSMKLFSFEK